MRMRAYVVLVLSLVLSTSTLWADAPVAPDWQWAVTAGGAGHDKARGLAVDAAGNAIVVGECATGAVFGDTELPNTGELDLFVTKVSPTGQILWTRTAGGSGDDRGYGVAVHSNGDILVSGSFASPTFSIGDYEFTRRGTQDLFVARYTAEGQLLWARAAGSSGHDVGHGAAFDPEGRCYVAGLVSGTAHFDDRSTNVDGNQLIIACYDAGGAIQWVQHAGGRGRSGARGMGFGLDGDLFVTGFCAGTFEVGGKTYTATARREVFVARLGRDGQWKWFHTAGGQSDGLGQGLGIDAEGNIYASGMFSGTIVHGEQSVTSVGNADIFLLRISPEGQPHWVRRAGGSGIDYSLDMVVDPRGTCYLAGDYSEEPEFDGTRLPQRGRKDLFVACYGADGKFHWARDAGGPESDVCYGIGLTHNGALCIAGAVAGELRIGGNRLASQGRLDVLVARLGSSK